MFPFLQTDAYNFPQKHTINLKFLANVATNFQINHNNFKPLLGNISIHDLTFKSIFLICHFILSEW